MKRQFPIGHPEHPVNVADLGSRGSGGIFIVSIMKTIAQKLRIIILLHFLGLITFNIHDWEIRKPLISMVSGPGGCDHDSQNQLSLILGAPRYVDKSKKIPNNS